MATAWCLSVWSLFQEVYVLELCWASSPASPLTMPLYDCFSECHHDVPVPADSQNLLNRNPWRNTGWLISISGWLIGTYTINNRGPVCSFPRITFLVLECVSPFSWPFCHFAWTTIALGMPLTPVCLLGLSPASRSSSEATSSLRVMTLLNDPSSWLRSLHHGMCNFKADTKISF